MTRRGRLIERLKEREQTIAVLQEFYDAQAAFDQEHEDQDLRAWQAAGERLMRARAAVEELCSAIGTSPKR